jgi:7-cyano-7-deazaguanine synthase
MLPNSIVLLSGGLDSCVALACAFDDSTPLLCLSVNYGQKHVRELRAAEDVAAHYKLKHIVLDLTTFGNVLQDLHASALVDPETPLPVRRRMSEMGANIPASYVPGRNTIMLALAQSIAEGLNADEIYCGFQATDFNGYPDTRPIFVEAWNHLSHYATKRGYYNNPIVLKAPVINLAKRSVVNRGLLLHAPMHLTWSCYTGGERPCGLCDSCIIRFNAFRDNNIDDPIGAYENQPLTMGL